MGVIAEIREEIEKMEIAVELCGHEEEREFYQSVLDDLEEMLEEEREKRRKK